MTARRRQHAECFPQKDRTWNKGLRVCDPRAEEHTASRASGQSEPGMRKIHQIGEKRPRW